MSESRIRPAEGWRTEYPGAMIGALALEGVVNPAQDAALDSRASDLETELRQRFAGVPRAEIADMPYVKPFVEYYRKFGKTYHLLLQLESVVAKGRTLRGPNALVQAMFLAEMKSMLLTAGHDLRAVGGSAVVDVAAGTETYTTLADKPVTLKAGDMFIRDDLGVISSILYGPDQRTRITAETRGVIYLVYAPPGLVRVDLERHLDDLETNTRVFAPHAERPLREILLAS